MTYDELCRAILEILPRAEIGEDLDGQLVVYTGLREVDAQGTLRLIDESGP